MSRLRVLGVLGSVAAVAIMAAGCGEDVAPPEVGEETASLGTILTCPQYASGTAGALLVMGAGVTEKKIELPGPSGSPSSPIQLACPGRIVDVIIPSTSSPNPADCTPNGCYSTIDITAGAGAFTGSAKEADSNYLYLPTTASSCNSYVHFVRLYKKLAGQTTFTYVLEFQYHGSWTGSATNGSCNITDATPPPNHDPHFPNDLISPLKPTFGTDTYRVVALVHNATSYFPVRFMAGYEAQ